MYSPFKLHSILLFKIILLQLGKFCQRSPLGDLRYHNIWGGSCFLRSRLMYEVNEPLDFFMKSSWKNKLVLFVKGQRECWRLSCFHSLYLASHQQGCGMTLIQSFRCIERISLHRRLCVEHAHWLPKVVWIGVEYDRSQMQQRGMLRYDPDNQSHSDSRVKEKEEEEKSPEGQRKHLLSLIWLTTNISLVPS